MLQRFGRTRQAVSDQRMSLMPIVGDRWMICDYGRDHVVEMIRKTSHELRGSIDVYNDS